MEITHNLADHRFEHDANGELAILEYRLHNGAIELLHTLVPPSMGGAGVGKTLAMAAFAYAKAEGIPVVVYCPFVAAYVERHPELNEQIRPYEE